MPACAHCGKLFAGSAAKRTFCSRACQRDASRVNAVCPTCDKSFWYYRNNPRTHCSRECLKKRVTLSCVVCGAPLSLRPSELKKGAKCCSRKCKGVLHGQLIAGVANPAWVGKTRAATCVVCGKPFASKNHPRTGWTVCCSRQCKGKRHTALIEGERNGRWAGGKSHEPYPIAFNNRLRASIRERDKFRCQLCGKHESDMPYKLDIHHIDYDKDNLAASNLIALCRACNSRVNHRRDHWQAHFREALQAHS